MVGSIHTPGAITRIGGITHIVITHIGVTDTTRILTHVGGTDPQRFAVNAVDQAGAVIVEYG